MRYLRFTAIVGLLFAASGARAQPAPGPLTKDQPAPAQTIAISGRVIDARGRPVRGAAVAVQDGPQHATTDSAGRFRLEAVALGATLVVDHDGYQTALATVTGAVLDDVVLLTQAQGTETIEVHGEPPPDAPGATKIDREDVQRIPGTGGDLVRTLTAMPGVVNSQLPTGPSGIVIRGSAPQDSKILVDDFEVPLLYHLIAFRAIMPTEAISTLDYVPGGFDVAYGRAGSGIVALTTRAGTDHRTEQAEVSALDGGALAQGSIGKDVQYMIGARRSTLDLILPLVIPASFPLTLVTIPYYYDLQARLDWQLSSRWKLTLSTIGSDDTLELFRDKTASADKRFFYQTQFLRTTATARYHEGAWTAVLSLSGMPDDITVDLAPTALDITRIDTTARGEVTRTAQEFAGLHDVSWRIGGEADISRYHLDLSLPAPPPNGVRGMGPEMQNSPPAIQFYGVVWTPDFATWTALSAGLDPRIRVTTALRLDYFARSGDTAVQPRGELQVKLAPKTTARFSAGAYRRPAEYQTELLHSNLHPERDTQVIAGVEHEPYPGIRIQTSLYYTDRSHLITYDAANQLANEGRGTTYGAELLATLREGPWFGWLSYSYSHSTRIDYPGAEQRLFEFDQPHSLNAAASWKQGKWQLGARFELYSGLPYTPVASSSFNSDTDSYAPIYGKPDSQRAPLHHQLDLRVDRTWHVGPVALTGFIDVQNVYLNRSVTSYGYSYDYSQRFAFTSLPIIPSIGVRGLW